MLSRNDFQKGLKVFRSCGGPNLDTQTIEVWYRMLNNLERVDFEGAVMAFCVEEKDLGFKNFVAEISQRAKFLSDRRKRNEKFNNKELPDKGDYVNQAMVKEFIKKFTEEVKKKC